MFAKIYDFFACRLFLENTCAVYPWYLALRGPVLGKSVLGIGLGFFCVLGLGPSLVSCTPPLTCSQVKKFCAGFSLKLKRKTHSSFCAAPNIVRVSVRDSKATAQQRTRLRGRAVLLHLLECWCTAQRGD